MDIRSHLSEERLEGGTWHYEKINKKTIVSWGIKTFRGGGFDNVLGSKALNVQVFFFFLRTRENVLCRRISTEECAFEITYYRDFFFHRQLRRNHNHSAGQKKKKSVRQSVVWKVFPERRLYINPPIEAHYASKCTFSLYPKNRLFIKFLQNNKKRFAFCPKLDRRAL